MKSRALLLAAAAAALLTASAAHAGIIIYVKWDSPSDGPGNQWSAAYHSIQNAINHSQPGDQIWVARGTYNERLSLWKERKLYGGFRGYENQLSERPAFPRAETDSYNSVIDAQSLGHCIHVENNSSRETRIDGFLMKNGRSREWEDEVGSGGGVYSAVASPTITNNIFWRCDANWGAGVYTGNGSPAVVRNRFYNCTSSCGGGVYVSAYAVDVSITENSFESNSATGDGGAVYCGLGSQAAIRSNVFEGNSFWYFGGALFLHGTGVVERNVFRGNTSNVAGSGGAAIYVSSADADYIIRNNLFLNNACWDKGGAIYFNSSSSSVTNNTFVYNQPSAIDIGWEYDGSITNNIVAWNGIGIVGWAGLSPSLVHNCFYGNTNGDYLYIPAGSDDIQQDPLFVSREADDYRLSRRSPCIEGGSGYAPGGIGDTDLSGQARVNGVVEIGAYELWDTIYYVNGATGSNSNGGTKFSDALATITEALNRSRAGDRIFVAKGTYNERITLKLGVEMYGGFSGSELNITQRPPFPRPVPDPNETVIDGQQLGTVVTMPANAPWTTWFDGFTITHGNSTNGGGLFCQDTGPTIKSCSFRQNVAANGGAVYLLHSSPTIEDCRFEQNVGTVGGGGIHSYFYSSPIIRRCLFKLCDAQSGNGGGVFCEQSNAALTGCIFNKCHAPDRGGAIYSTSSSPYITGNSIANCSASSGGAIALSGGAGVLTNNLVAYNSSGVYGENGAAPELYTNCFWGNTNGNYNGVPPGGIDLQVDPRLYATEYDEFHLPYDSPCMDKGSDSAAYITDVDIDSQGRKNGRTDIGADEFWQGKTYYVSAPDGSDSNSGLDEQHPLRTIGAALKKCIFGDSIQVGYGEYAENVTLKRGVACEGYVGGSPAFTSYLTGAGSGSIVTCEYGADHYTRMSSFKISAGSALQGGGIACVSASPIFERVSLSNCTAQNGGAIFIADGSPLFKSGYVSNCEASGKGGAVCCIGASSHPVFNGMDFWENTAADDGGAIFCQDGALTVNGASVRGNTSGQAGGAIRCMFAYPALTSNFVHDNGAQYGAGIHIHGGTAYVINNTITDNWSTVFGGGINCDSATVEVHNNIIAFNSAGVFGSGGALNLSHNDVFGNFLYPYWGVSPGAGDISLDPLLGSGDWNPAAASPCINAGNNHAPSLPATDVREFPRIAGGVVDIGAFEVEDVTTLDYAKFHPGGSPVDIDGLIVTAVFSDYYYVETADRAMGIRVQSPYASPPPGWSARLQGRCWRNADGERYIQVQSEMLTPATPLKPLAIRGRYLGGDGFRYSSNYDLGQQGVKGGAGLNNIGLYVQIYGRVSFIGRDYFYVDDGSGADDESGNAGIKVKVPSSGSIPAKNARVLVTGASSCFKIGEDLHPRVLVSQPEDIQVLGP